MSLSSHTFGCIFCGMATSIRCDRPAILPRRQQAQFLRVGDVIWRANRPDHKSMVIKIDRHSGIVRMLVRKKYGSNKTKEFFLYGFDEVITYRAALCAKWVCEMHHREPAENYHVCADHWPEIDSGIIVPAIEPPRATRFVDL